MPTAGFLNIIFHGPWGLGVAPKAESPDRQLITAVTPQINGSDPHVYLIGDVLLYENVLPAGDFVFTGLTPVAPPLISDTLAWHQEPGHPRNIPIPSYAGNPQGIHCTLAGLPMTQIYGLRAAQRIHAGMDVLVTGPDQPQLTGNLFPLVVVLRYAYNDPSELALAPAGGGPPIWTADKTNLLATNINLHIYAQSAGDTMPPPNSDDFATMASLFALHLEMGGPLADQRVDVDLVAGDFGLQAIDELALGERPLPPCLDSGRVGTKGDPLDCGIPLLIFVAVGVEIFRNRDR